MIDGKTFPVCLKPEEIADFKDSLKKLLDSTPAGKARAGLEAFCAKFNERMEDRGANKYPGCLPNEAPIDADALKDIYEISQSLSSTMIVFDLASTDGYGEAFSILHPVVTQLERIVREHFPDYVSTMA